MKAHSSDMNSNAPISVRRRDPLAIVSFLLALVLMVIPVEAGILDPALRRSLALASLVAMAFFAVVLIPFLLALRRRRREPLVWRGGGFLIVTGAILALNATWFGLILIHQLFR